MAAPLHGRVTSRQSNANIRRFFETLDDPSDSENEVDVRDDEIDLPVVNETDIIDRRPIEQAEGNRVLDADEEEGWSSESTPPLVEPFTGRSNVHLDVSDEKHPYEFFKFFITDEVINQWCAQTNEYAFQQTDVTYELPPHARILSWYDITPDEMKAYLALVIATGLVKKDDLDKFWSTDNIIETPFFTTHMSLKRFENISSNLHIANNVDDEGDDALYKVRPFLTHLRRKFLDAYTPSQNLSFDEATCGYKGRLRFKVYNPKKPTKYGIKIYEVCESESGYLLGMNVYTGGNAEETFHELIDIPDECCLTTKLVVGLMAYCGLLHKGHHVYLDNYYVSPELFEELNLLGTGACGTLRMNRKGTPAALKKNARIPLRQGETLFRQKGNLLAVKHVDKRDVHMLSTIHDSTMVTLKKKDIHGNNIVKPELIVEYVKNMGGVDLSDQLMKNYSCIRRSVKWWKKFFFHLFCSAMCNAYILYKKSVDRPLDHFQFRSQIVRALLLSAPGNPGPSSSGRKLSEVPERLNRNFGHFPKYCDPKPGAKRQKPMRDCAVCNVPQSKRNGFKRVQTSFECKHCQVPLCIPICFEAYHTKLDYKPRH